MAERPQISSRAKLAVVLLVLLVLCGWGIARWWTLRGEEGDTPPPRTTPSSSPIPVEPVDPGGSETSTSPTPTAPPTPRADQEKSARAVLKEVVPVWASLEYSKTGPDADAWVDTWGDLPGVSGEFQQQSHSEFAYLMGGVVQLEADAKVDALKSVDLLRKEANVSSWRVQMDRMLTSADGSGVLNETEPVKWEFVVEQDPDSGESEIMRYRQLSDQSY